MMTGRKGAVIIRILSAVLCLLTLTACSKVSQSYGSARDGDEQTVEQAEDTEALTTEAQKSPATEQETGSMIIRPLAYQVDLTHDEKPELLVVDELLEGDSVDLVISVIQGDDAVWTDHLGLKDSESRRAYFLCSIGGEDYLVAYRAYLEEGSCRYICEVFYLEDGRIKYVDNDMLLFRTDSYEDYPLDVEKIRRFSNWINWYMTRSTLICFNDNGTYTYSTTDTQRQYTEEFEEAFSTAVDYTGCTTVVEKVERLNEYLYRQWFGESDPEGTALTAPDGFEEIAEEMLEETRQISWMGRELSEDPSIWFEAYNGRPLQIVLGRTEYTTPLACNDVVYYQASKEETLEEIARKMVEAMIAEMTMPSTYRSFTVTDYRIVTQNLKDLKKGLEACWKAYRWDTREAEGSLRVYVRDWLLNDGDGTGFVPVGENMWYFCPQGYFSFTGECADGVTMEDMMSASPETVVGEKIPFTGGEDIKSVQFVLIKDEDSLVYRLQRAEAMEGMFEDLLTETQPDS